MTREFEKSRPPSKQKKEAAKTPWYKRVWVVVSAICAVISALVIKGPEFLQSARILPEEIRKTSTQFLTWSKDDAQWTGRWSSFPEGIVNMADLQLSDVDMQITTWSKEGIIDGTIVTKKICNTIPTLNYVLLRGKVSGNTATVTAWDIVQGRNTDFAQLKIVREGEVITVTPTDGLTEWFPEVARLGRHPSDGDKELGPDQTYCAQERKFFFEKTQPAKNTQG